MPTWPISLGPCCRAPVLGSKCFCVASFRVLLISLALGSWVLEVCLRSEEMCPGSGSLDTDEDGEAELVSSFSS